MTERNTNKKRKYLIITILAAVVMLHILVALIYLHKIPIDLSSRHAKIESMIEKRIGQKVTAETIILKVLPSPEITLTNLHFMDGTESFIEVAELQAKFSLIQLIAGNKVIKKLDITSPVFKIRRDSGGAIRAIELIKAIRARIKRAAKIRKLTITGGQVNLTDELPATAKLFNIKGVEANFNDSRQGILNYDVSAALDSGTFSFKGEGRRFKGKLRLGGHASLRGLNIKRINPYLKMSGSRPLPAGQDWQQGASLDLETDIIIAADSISLALNEIKLLMYDFEINGSLKADTETLTEGTRQRNALKSYEIAINTGPVPFAKFRDLVDKIIPSGELKKQLSELTPLDGELSLEELSIADNFGAPTPEATDKAEEATGEAATLDTRSIRVKLGLKNLRFKYRGLNETFSGVNGRLLYHDDILAFDAMTGNYGAGVVKDFNGVISKITTVPHYDLSLNAFFETEKTLAILKEFQRKIPGDMPEWLKGLETSGLTDINIKIRGDLNAISETDYSGTLRFKKARFAHPDLPLTLRSLDGELTFDNHRLTLKNLKCADDESLLNLNGYIKGYLESNPWFDISATGEVHRSSLLAFVRNGPAKELLFDNLIGVKVRARGTSRSLKTDLRADLTDTTLKFKGLIDKAKGVELTMDTRIDYARKADGSVINVKEMTLAAGGSKLNIAAKFPSGRPYSATIESKGIRFADIKDISAHINSKTDAVGFIELALEAAGENKKNRLYTGRIALSNGRFSTKLIPAPIKRLNAEVNFNGTEAKLTITDFEAGKTRLVGDIDIDDIATRSIRFDIKSSEFHLEDLFTVKSPLKETEETATIGLSDNAMPKEPVDKKSLPPSIPARKVTGNGTIKVTKGSAFGFTFNDLDAGIRLVEDAIYFSPITMLKNNGPTSMDLTLYRNPSSRLIFDADINFINIHLEPLITELGSKKTIFAGDLNGTAVLWGIREAKSLAAGINGEVKLSTGQGKMWKFLLLRKIFSVVNILSIDELFKDGLRYKTIKGDFAIRNGVISTTNLALDSDSLRMSAIGELKIPDAYIDGILIMHPFVTMDKVLTSIPLAGWIIGGEKGTTLGLYYQVIGPLKKPYIEPVPAKGLQKGVVGILKRLLEEPLGGLKVDKKKEGEKAPVDADPDEIE